MRIEHTMNSVEGENLYWRGAPPDYLRLVSELHALGCSEGVEVYLNDCDFVQVDTAKTIKLKSSKEGRTLCAVDDKEILVDLDARMWREVLFLFLSISFSPSHNYVEFDDIELEECANIIISSEA